MKPMHRIFCDAYIITGDATGAYKEAFPSCRTDLSARTNASKLLKRPEVNEYLNTLMSERSNERIASGEEVLQFLTSSMRNEDIGPRERLKAAELLGKRYRLFVDRVETTAIVQVVFEGEAELEDYDGGVAMGAIKLKVNIARIVGRGYKEIWNCRKRYLVIKGSRGSKKSTTIALRILYNMMRKPLSNTLVVRRIFNTHKDSTWAQLKWAANALGVSHLWQFSKSPLEAVYLPTGQRILFRGLDNPLSVTSITVEKGHIDTAWFEEAFQVSSEADFDTIDMSIRGQMPAGYFPQIILTFNPWSDKSWLKKRFFDVQDDNVLAVTTTYRCNEFLDAGYIDMMEKMRETNPRRFRIEGDGDWGISEGLVYDNWIESLFDFDELMKRPGMIPAYGLDFGFTDPTALIACLVDDEAKELYIFDELYKPGLLNNEIAAQIKYMNLQKAKIIADAADPRSIEELKKLGILRIKAAKKGPDSIIHGIQKVQQYRIYIHPRCTNMIVEMSNYIWDSKAANKPIDDYCHLQDALRYAIEGVGKGSGISVLK